MKLQIFLYFSVGGVSGQQPIICYNTFARCDASHMVGIKKI